MQDWTELEQECRALCRCLGCAPPPADLVEAYVRANEVVFRDEPDDPPGANGRRLVAEALRRRYDLEAIECALRRRNRDNALTKKLHILVYLVETQPGYYEMLHNPRDRRLRAFLALGFHSVRSIGKLAKGMFLCWRLRSLLARD